MNAKKWLILHFTILLSLLLFIVGVMVYLDPYMHYHYPLSDKFYYLLTGNRNLNHGILEHFDYDALITGTSMTENFETSELDSLFGTSSVKVPSMGATYKECSNLITHALKHNNTLRLVVRGLDLDMLFYGKDDMRTDLGRYPEFLYDENIFNDVEYLFNREAFFRYACNMLSYRIKDFPPGITSFDEYSNWGKDFTYGMSIIPQLDADGFSGVGAPMYLSDDEALAVRENIQANIVSLAKANPQIDFYCFFTPYSAVWWQEKVESGKIYKVLQAEQIAIEEMLTCENIKLFSICDDEDICADLNNYRDHTHYGPWINSLILKLMRDERCMLTESNYLQHLEAQRSLYTGFDYNSLLTQEDYEDDLIIRENIFSKYGY